MKKNVTIILNMVLHNMKKNIVYIHLGSKTTADGDCSHEIKRNLFLGRKAMTNIDSIFKSRDNTLLTKVCLVKDMIFSSSHYGHDSWTIGKLIAEELMPLSCSVEENS